MNYVHSTDFNAGFICNKVERIAFSILKDKQPEMEVSQIVIPIIQVFPKMCSDEEEKRIVEDIVQTVCKHFDAIFRKTLCLNYECKRDKRYFTFNFEITRKR